MKYQGLLLVMYLAWCRAQFVDDMQQLEAECMGDGKFACMTKGCIDQEQYCDGIVDCEDGSDENYCTNNTAAIEFCNETHQYTCRDTKKCIPLTWLCNNEADCDDGSDEVNCTALPPAADNSTCKGFKCGDGKCISRLWVCDGVYDCDDRSDEYSEELCRHTTIPHIIMDGTDCQEFTLDERNYQCLDYSYCLPGHMMCDGVQDCRDGSDEGSFCKSWHTMCANYTCSGNETQCSPERYGPGCICKRTERHYNYITKQCDDIDECVMERPQCSQICVNLAGNFNCKCEPGYTSDQFNYLCFAGVPEAKLFFSTRHDIRYVKIKSKQVVTVATGIKEAHGVSFDGTYIYWVETALGYQSIFKAQVDDFRDTKQVLVGVGLENPGDIAVDYLGGNIYFSDAERGIISACRADGSICTTIKTETVHPRFVTLDPRKGQMYWSDWHNKPVIMSADMDGSQPDMLVERMDVYATGLAIDAPNGRLYFVDKTIKVVLLKGKHVYSLFAEPFHHPYSISVFENTVFWSDWFSNSIQMTDKLHGTGTKRSLLVKLDTPALGMHMYHPVLMNTSSNPCSNNECSHLCLITSKKSHVCACPDGMYIIANVCHVAKDYRPKYLVVAAGQLFTRIQYDTLGNPDSHTTHFDIGRVQALAYDQFRDSLFLYDGQRKTVNYINMTDFGLGLTHLLVYGGLENVVDMDYDYATDNLYILDEGRRVVEAFSLRTQKRTIILRFREYEQPISLCVLPNYGRMLIAVVEKDLHNRIHIDSFGLDGMDREYIVKTNLRGPHIRMRYIQHMDLVFLSDESNGVIDYIHPEGSGRENYRDLSTSVASLAVADNYVFWTDRRTSRLFWSDLHQTSHKIRRIDLALFPNNTQLLIQATTSPLDQKDPLVNHPCLKNICSDVCVQQSHEALHQNPSHYTLDHKCMCPPGLLLGDDTSKCTKFTCYEHEFLCYKTNDCVPVSSICNHKADCAMGEDEEGCTVPSQTCSAEEIFCEGMCVKRDKASSCSSEKPTSKLCSDLEFKCKNSSICLSRVLLCDGHRDCPDGSDELGLECGLNTCLETEFRCVTGTCILKTWACDGVEDCDDGSDEVNCGNATCSPGFYQCRNRECVELRKVCDNHQDCADFSDEENCEAAVTELITEAPPRCSPWEYTCELNTSICLPRTARCNMRVECPGATDEHDCEIRCAPRGQFECRQQLNCIPMSQVCNWHQDCADGSDETPDACASVNKSSFFFPIENPITECADGFLCNNGQCIESKQLCDKSHDCIDGSDEGGLCETACDNMSCSYLCHPTPVGGRCICPFGYRLRPDLTSCEDIDECAEDLCSQRCTNVPGSFLCSCYHGYALRMSDRRSCKAIRGKMVILYVRGNTVRSISSDGFGDNEYVNKGERTINDIDYDVRQKKLYVTSAQSGKLIEVNSTKDSMVVTNIGRPTKVAVDWVTGNVYFVDSSKADSCIRLCNINNKRCARLQKVPSDAKISALIVEPSAGLMFYCMTRELESVIWSATLAGTHVTDLTTVHNCTGLASDPFKKKLYVAETGPAHIISMDYEGDSHKKILADHPQLEAPHDLAIYEDYIYYLVANSFRLGRCRLFGPKHCETYIFRVFDANTFVIRHESVQRDDLVNQCTGVECGHICAMGKDGPLCVCGNGFLTKRGKCPKMNKKNLPLFNGLAYEEPETGEHVMSAVFFGFLLLLLLYLSLLLYYRYIYAPRRRHTINYAEVRFQNTSAASSPSNAESGPSVQVTTETTATRHEYVNPLQSLRNKWYSSFRQRSRPQVTEEIPPLTVPQSPPQIDLSDTESDLDVLERK